VRRTLREILKRGVAVAAPLALAVSSALAQPLPGGTLDPTTIPKYVQPLVIPPVMNDTGTAHDYDIAVRQFQQQILPGAHWNAVSPACQATPGLCNLPATTVWSYGPAADPLPDSSGLPGGALGLAPALNSQFNYPAFTVENIKDTQTSVDWINDLKENFGAGPNYLPHLLPIDQTLHWANPGADCIDDNDNPRTDCRGQSQLPYTGPVPVIVHVHGAHSTPESDGYPEAWYLPDSTGSNFTCVNDPALADNVTNFVCEGTLVNQYGTPNTANGVASFTYQNDQPTATFWYHDHSLGMTRNNVYAGPAGFWLLRTAAGGEEGLVSGTLPGPAPVADDDPNFNAAVRNTIREIPIVIQDRSFNADGSLFYPADRAFFEGLTPPELQIDFIPDGGSDISPIWNPEAFFNTMVVNGTTWPELEVAPAIYRFRFLNGCNSRFLNLRMAVVNGQGRELHEIPFYQIGAEQSLLPQVVRIETGFATALPGNGSNVDPNRPDCLLPNGKLKNNCVPAAPAQATEQALLMGLAERADVLVDFRGRQNGDVIRMFNTAPDAPFGGFPDVPADAGTTGQVMQFRVNSALLGASPTDPGGATPATDPWNLVLSLPDPGDPANNPNPFPGARDLALLEEESAVVCVTTNAVTGAITQVEASPPACAEVSGSVPFAPKAAVLGYNGAGGGTVQLWSDDVQTNPGLGATETWELWNWTVDGHPIHLHLVKFKVVNREAFDPATGTLSGVVNPPTPTEAGWKDTVIAYPGQVTRVNSTFDIAGLYVWHCHIVEHEDNEMMVPYCVGDPTQNGCQNLTFAQ
jgi:spore coat protein A, manganese oxidase